MEIKNPSDDGPQGKVVFIKLEPEMYEKLEELRVQMRGRGIATVIRLILQTALAEGITVGGQKKKAGRRREAEGAAA